MKTVRQSLWVWSLMVAFGNCVATANDSVVLVRDGKSDHVIAVAPDATMDVTRSAAELQRVIQIATGVQLPIVNDRVQTPAIRFTPDDGLPPDGFEIRIQHQDIVISGNDQQTATSPDRWFLPSHGSAYGTDEFLERFLGVRWLMPGEIGEDIPKLAEWTVSIPEPIRNQPSFALRMLTSVGEDVQPMPPVQHTAIKQWLSRQRLTNARHPLLIGYGHSWDDYIHAADMEKHPEWHAVGGPAVRGGKVKYFCTTAPGLVETFAARVIERLDRNAPEWSAPISPTDGGDFCRCERCTNLLSKDPHGNVNHAQAMLDFYRQVSEIVLDARPNRRIAGFAYYNYQYPPTETLRLPENFSLAWAPLNYYGYGLLKPVYQAEFDATLSRWSELSAHLCYRSYSTWMRSYHGAPLPVSMEILNLELPSAAKYDAWGASMTGTSAWGVNAPINYLLAKQMWKTDLDLNEAFNEWLARAYGPGWPSIRELYNDLEHAMKSHKESQPAVYKGSQYEVNEEVMRVVYAPLFESMEARFRHAFSLCESEPQRARMLMFADNLIQLHYALRKARLIDETQPSIFYRDDRAFETFIAAMNNNQSLYRDHRGVDQGPIWKGEWQSP